MSDERDSVVGMLVREVETRSPDRQFWIAGLVAFAITIPILVVYYFALYKPARSATSDGHVSAHWNANERELLACAPQWNGSRWECHPGVLDVQTGTTTTGAVYYMDGTAYDTASLRSP